MISISNFGGMMPRQNAAMLPNAAAQIARNCKLWHGDLRPLKSAKSIHAPVPLARAIKSIYRMGMSLPETQYWLTWTSDVDVARGIVAGDTAERTYFTGDGVPKVTNLQMATQGGNSYPVNAYTLGVPAPTQAATCVPSASAVPAETRVYIWTYVSAWGEEGAPSPPTKVTVSENGSVQLGQLVPAPAGNYNIAAKRIYRSQQTSSGTAIYQFVREIPDATTEFNDTLLATELGEELATLSFAMPPPTLTGLVALPNGIMAGFSGYDLFFCEPNLPYAWPEKYRLTADYPIVGLGVFGSSLLVCTKGTPYLVTGMHPDSMSMERIELDQACVSKRSIVSIGGAVMYASPDGLVNVGVGGSRVVTESLYTREEWQALRPESIEGYFHDGKYVGLYAGGGFILNSLEDASLTMFDEAVTAGYVDAVSDALYFAIDGVIRKFNDGDDKEYTWRSKKFLFSARPGPGCARIDADSYPLIFNLYADGVLVHTQHVENERPFRLPSGYRPREIELELIGKAPVRLLAVADKPQEFKLG